MHIPGILRKRYVLATIFLSSLFYFLVKTGLLRAFMKEQKRYVEERELESQRKIAYRHIQWFQTASLPPSPPSPGDKCRNTRQGRTVVADDRGYVCGKWHTREGCCEGSEKTERFSCANCSFQSNCCSSYEHCVSCCLNPDKKNLLEMVIREANSKRMKLFVQANDQFDLCLVKCRTSSSSVFQENKYKNSKMKHCFGLEPKLPFL